MSTKTQELVDLDELVIKNGNSNREVTSKINKSGQLAETEMPSLVEVTDEEVRAAIEARVQAAYEKAMAQAREERAEPFGWWDLYAVGPFQPTARPFGLPVPPAPYLPHSVIRVGEIAYIVTILYAPTVNVFGLPYEIDYSTGSLDTWRLGPNSLNVTHRGHLNPHSPFIVDLLRFRAQEHGCFETNICARIYGCPYKGKENTAPPFAGFATRVIDLDGDMFVPGIGRRSPGLRYDGGLRFQVYE
jgi:hypothetical protein